jgi:hypothetical protein
MGYYESTVNNHKKLLKIFFKENGMQPKMGGYWEKPSCPPFFLLSLRTLHDGLQQSVAVNNILFY